MNKNIEENLRNIKLKDLSEQDKNQIWSHFTFAKTEFVNNKKSLSLFNIKQYMLKKYAVGIALALVIILGGAGVVAASNSSAPGDLLFGIDKALEKIELSLASDSKKEDLKFKFVEERLSETEKVLKESGSVNGDNIDLSSSSVTGIEVDVFTNETTVKVEANGKYYGFLTQEKDKEKIINEIKTKYNLTSEKINSVLSFEVEDRASRADDKGFLNSLNSIKFKSEKQSREIKASLDSVADVLADSNLSDANKAQISATLATILTLIKANPDLEFEVKTKDGFKVEVEDGKVEIKVDDKGENGDDDSDDKDDKSDDHGNDVKENEDEVFCRGEWRDAEDCDASSSSQDDNSDDDTSDSNDDDSNDEDDNSGHGGDGEDDKEDYKNEDDNSGHGGGDDGNGDN